MAIQPARLEILIVEDGRTQAELLKHLLDQNGYAVTIASNGKRVLSMVRESKPALIISDIVMPKMDGYELCRQIKGEPTLGEIPVILLTQLSSPPIIIIKGLQCEADNFIIKPYDGEYLLSRIARMIASVKKKGEAKVRKGCVAPSCARMHSIIPVQEGSLTAELATVVIPGLTKLAPYLIRGNPVFSAWNPAFEGMTNLRSSL
jgi:two-component system, sensor histidine kinase and response regulator